MKHAAHKAMAHKAATMSTAQRGLSFPSLFAWRGRGAHSVTRVAVAQTASGTVVETDIDARLAAQFNAVIPVSRRSFRESARAAQRRSMLLTSTSLAALVGTAAATMVLINPMQTSAAVNNIAATTTQLKRVNIQGVSRSQERTDLDKTSSSGQASAQTTNEGTWQLSDTNTTLNVDGMTKVKASNAKVAALMDADQQVLPNGFNPDHASGDSGNAYEFSQCTWWVYVRRHQLGLPVGSHMGNGNMWGNSARSLGYWVDHTARHVGDIMVFAAGQDGADAMYGHVAVIEKINSDGSVTTSESGSVMNGATYSHTYSAADVAQHDIIHY